MKQSARSEARFLLVQLLRVCATVKLNLGYHLFSLTGTCGITSELVPFAELAENELGQLFWKVKLT